MIVTIDYLWHKTRFHFPRSLYIHLTNNSHTNVSNSILFDWLRVNKKSGRKIEIALWMRRLGFFDRRCVKTFYGNNFSTFSMSSLISLTNIWNVSNMSKEKNYISTANAYSIQYVINFFENCQENQIADYFSIERVCTLMVLTTLCQMRFVEMQSNYWCWQGNSG